MVTPDMIITEAKKWVGYLEKRDGNEKYLSDKTANAGDKNYTIFGKTMHDIYPKVMDYPAPWCDSFCDFIFMQVAGVSTAKSLLCGNFDDYTVNSAQLYKNAGAWYTSPVVGDQIFFKNSSRICHTGLVYHVDSTYVYTIEGNTSQKSGVVANGGCVATKKYLKTSKSIAGYGRPRYDNVAITEPSVSLNKKEQWIGEVTASNLNVRRGAGSEFANISSCPSVTKGTQVYVCDSQKASDGAIWYYIKIKNDTKESYGFVHSGYIKAKGTNIVNNKIDDVSGNYKVKSSGLNMRKEAGVLTKDNIVTTLRNGDTVTCEGSYKIVDGSRWLHVTYKNFDGWCSSTYLTKI